MRNRSLLYLPLALVRRNSQADPYQDVHRTLAINTSLLHLEESGFEVAMSLMDRWKMETLLQANACGRRFCETERAVATYNNTFAIRYRNTLECAA